LSTFTELGHFYFFGDDVEERKSRTTKNDHVQNLTSHSLEVITSGVFLLLTHYDIPFKPRPLSN
jgi:hypothetical protein